MKSGLFVFLVLGLTTVGHAKIVLRDYFDNDDLATAPASTNVAGGFYEVDNGVNKDGFSEEIGGYARLVNGTKKNITGLISSNTVNLLSSSVTTWNIRDYDISNVSSYIGMTWQTDAGYTPYPELSIIADLTGNGLTFFENGTNTIGHQNLTLAFEDFSGFSLISSFNETSYSISGIGINLDGGLGETNVIFSGNWVGAEKSYADLLLDDYHLGAFVNGQNNEAASYNIESVSVDVIPEPTVMALIGLFGGGLLVSRRIFG